MLATQPKGTQSQTESIWKTCHLQVCSTFNPVLSHDNLGHSNSLHDADSQIPLQIRPIVYLILQGRLLIPNIQIRVFHQLQAL